MGAIKDIADLSINLAERIQDRKISAELIQIQTLVLEVQRDQIELVERNRDLVTENAQLRSELARLESELELARNPSIDASEINQEMIDILLIQSAVGAVTLGDLEQRTGSNGQRLRHFLDVLVANDLNHQIINIASYPTRWNITANGRKLLFDRGLLENK